MLIISSFSPMRRIAALALAVLSFGLDATAAEPIASRPPNVLFLIADQHNYAVLGSAGNTLVKTPNLDRLASEGVTVTRATAVTPFCSPTRASLITGQWPHVHGIVSNVVGERGQPKITDRHVTLDNILFDKGYRLRHFGRWMVGKRTDLRAYRGGADRLQEKLEYRGWFRERRGTFITGSAHPGEVFLDKFFMTASIARSHAIWKSEPQRSPQDLSLIGRSPIAPEGQIENWLADKAIGWMEANADKPFMLTYSVRPPHASWAAPDPYHGMYDPKRMQLPESFYDRAPAYRESQAARMVKLLGEQGVREYLRCYYAQVTMIDHLFGKILNKLRELGLEENTLVIFTSDHGDMQGGHAMMGKLVPAYYDEILRVPLIVRYPASIPKGQVLDQHASSVDVMPTVLDYLGIPVPDTVQGRSLRPQLDGTTEPDDRPAFSERSIAGPDASRMIRTRKWKYAVFGDGRRELFHLSEDPHELHDLAGDVTHRSQRNLLEQKLRDWMLQARDPALATLFSPATAM